MPELPGDRGSAPRSGRAGACESGRAGRPGACRDAEDVRPAAARARGPAPRRSTPPGQALALPERGRRARAPRPSDERRAAATTSRPGGKAPKTPAFRLLFAGRRRTRAHRGRLEEARAGRRLRRRRPSRRSSLTSGRRHSASAPTGSARSSPPSRAGCIRCCVTSGPSPASAAPGRTRSSHRARLSPYALSTELDAGRGRAPRRSDRRGARARARAAGARACANAKIYRVHDRLGQPCPQCGDADRPRSTSRSTRSTTARAARRRAAF